MILRIDDTDVDRNTQASLDSISDGLNWLGLAWDEFYRQSERLELHRQLAYRLLAEDGRSVTRADIRRDVARLFRGNFERFTGLKRP